MITMTRVYKSDGDSEFDKIIPMPIRGLLHAVVVRSDASADYLLTANGDDDTLVDDDNSGEFTATYRIGDRGDNDASGSGSVPGFLVRRPLHFSGTTDGPGQVVVVELYLA